MQTQDFDVSDELAALRAQRKDVGAVVNFVGYVRDLNEGDDVSTMTLEHYPGMTEKALQKIAATAHTRWSTMAISIIHRIGRLKPSDQIVLVAVASAHRQDAFEACAFIMDYLKTDAPFWKKEETSEGTRWVEAKQSDDLAKDRWEATNG